jgi:hypothetical protein
MQLYTMDGRPLQISGGIIYSRFGTPVGRISGDRVYGPDGRYVGTITSGRLIYRSTDSASEGSPFSVADRAGSGSASAARSALRGDEPDIPG